MLDFLLPSLLLVSVRLAVLHGQLETLEYLVNEGAVLGAGSHYPVQQRDWNMICRQFKLPDAVQVVLQGDKYHKEQNGLVYNLRWHSLPFYAVMLPHLLGLPHDKVGTESQKRTWDQAQMLM